MTNQNERMQAVLNEMFDEQLLDEQMLEEEAVSGVDNMLFSMWGENTTESFSFPSLKSDGKVLVTNDSAYIDKLSFTTKANRFLQSLMKTKQRGVNFAVDKYYSAKEYVRANGAKTYFWREYFVPVNGHADYNIDDLVNFNHKENDTREKGERALYAKAILEFRRHVVNTVTRYNMKIVEGKDVLKRLMSKEAEKDPKKFFNENAFKNITCKPMQIDGVVYAEFSFHLGRSLKFPFSDNLTFYTRPCEVVIGEQIEE